MPDPVAELVRYVAAKLDREISDTAPAVQHVWLDNRLRRACVNTPSTASAAGRSRRVHFQFEIRQDAAEKDPGADLLIDDARVFAEPADPGIFCIHSFEDWTSVHIRARLSRKSLLDPAGELLKLFLQIVVIVRTPG